MKLSKLLFDKLKGKIDMSDFGTMRNHWEIITQALSEIEKKYIEVKEVEEMIKGVFDDIDKWKQPNGEFRAGDIFIFKERYEELKKRYISTFSKEKGNYLYRSMPAWRFSARVDKRRRGRRPCAPGPAGHCRKKPARRSVPDSFSYFSGKPAGGPPAKSSS